MEIIPRVHLIKDIIVNFSRISSEKASPIHHSARADAGPAGPRVEP
jgi:hypothetical protein